MLPPPPIKRSGEIEMTSDGARLPEKNAFEFTMRPHSQILKSDRKSSREDGAS